MFLRCKKRHKDGKEHLYWSIVENRRIAGGKVLQRHVLYLGELNGRQEASWQKTIDLFDYENDLWIKNEAFGNKFSYIGNNVFESPNSPKGLEVYMKFEIASSENIKFSIGRDGGDQTRFIKKS